MNSEISPTELLLRRIAKAHIKPDGQISDAAFKGDLYRISTAEFSNEELSVDRQKLLSLPEDALKNFPDFGLASLEAQVPTSLNLSVVPDPIPQNQAHALIKGKKTQSIRKKLKDAASWVVPVPDFKIFSNKQIIKESFECQKNQ